MIKKSRLNTTTPSVLTDQNAISEYNEIQAYYRLHGNTPSKLFKVYSKDEVKKSLLNFFMESVHIVKLPMLYQVI